jgi:hypothetical protein
VAVRADLFARFLGQELELAAGKLRSVTSNTTARPKPPFSRGPIETAHFTVAFDASSCAIWRYGRAHRQAGGVAGGEVETECVAHWPGA